MFRHSLLLIYRSALRFKSTFFINLVGLASGLACALLIFLWVNDELKFDKFHEKDARLYQVLERWEYSTGISIEDGTPGLLAEHLAAEMPEVEYAAAVVPAAWYPNLTLSADDKNIRAAGQWVGKDYFSIFSFPLIEGDADRVLADKHAVVISQSLAERLFNTTEGVLGKSITLQHNEQFVVSGIFKDTPPNSSQQFDVVFSYSKFKEDNPWMKEWGNSSPETYLVLKEGVDRDRFAQQIRGYLNTKGDYDYRTLFIKPFSENYLYGKYENGQQAGGRIEYVRLFTVVAVFILLIACINFMNLSTAKASRRLKEIGIKKTIGASRRVLIFQYLGESLLMTFLSLILAVALVIALLPLYNEITGKPLSLDFNLTLVLAITGITLLTGLLAGSYPALYLSGFSPLSVLKRGASSGKSGASAGDLWVRKGLVIVQFALSVILVVAVLVVYQQIEYVQNKQLGYDKDNVIYFEREGALGDKLEAFLTELNAMPGVVKASSSSHNLLGHHTGTDELQWEGKAPGELIEFEYASVNYELLETLGIEMAHGRTFSEAYGADDDKIILNSAAIKAMGLSDPIGKTVRLWGNEKQIIGVTHDFHFQSLHEKVRPMFFILRTGSTDQIIAKITAGKERETIAGLEELYKSFNPGFSFDYKFLDQEYQAQYAAEQRVSVLSRYFAGIAILISCLGLYGLVAFAAEQRRKEIGIRKVLGASVANIMTLLSKDFIKLVALAIVIGSLLSWMAMSKWLEGFAYRIELSWWVFGVAGAAALLIALFTVGYQAIKAAMANPVKNLRTE